MFDYSACMSFLGSIVVIEDSPSECDEMGDASLQ